MSRFYFNFILVVSLMFLSCSKKEDEALKIGFIAGLSGKYSSLGIDVRDGFELAFMEIDYKIGNKKVKIIEKDDKQDEKEAQKVINELIKDNIKLIVGNTTSAMTKISYNTIKNKKDMLLISATASSSYFSGKDDNFLRVQIDNSPKRFIPLVKKLTQNGYKNIFFIGDYKNKVYINDYLVTMQNIFKKYGANSYTATIDINNNYKDILKEYKKTKSDLILIVANAIDSANMIQYLRANGVKAQIVASSWAKTHDFIENGGKAVEGVVFTEGFDINSKNKRFLKFVKQYEKIYNKMPTVFSMQGYELGKILIKNLQKSFDISKLKDNILKEKVYKGLQGDIVFDKYADVIRDFFLIKVENGKFVQYK